jgi:hypothetical protein
MLRRRTIELDGPSTSVADRDAGGQPDLPVRVIAHPSVKPAIDAAIAAVRSGTIPAASAGRARLLIASALLDPAAAAPAPVRAAWIADALATLSQDAGVQRAAARVSRAQAPIDFSRQPWHALARGADGRVLVAGAGADGDLLVASAAPADDLLTPVLLRAICDALAPAAPVAARDILPTADEDLRAWERPPQPVVRPRLDTVVDDDRRWMWTATLALLAIETWMRRSRRRDDGQIAAGEENRARVA